MAKARTARAGGKNQIENIEDHRRRQRRLKSRAQYYDYSLLFFLIVLLGVGYVMLYSTSSYAATLKGLSSTYYLKKQITASLLGFAGLAFCSLVDYHLWQRLAFPIYVVSLGLCLALFIPGVGVEHNESVRWIEIAGVEFQPSEIAKVALIIMLAAVIARHANALKSGKSVLKMFGIILPFAGVIAVSNLSTAIVVFGIGFVMIFIAARENRIFVMVVLVAAVGATIMMLIPQLRYRMTRVTVWLNPEQYPDDAYQTMQGLYAIGSGGLLGKGLGESVQKMGPLPEAQNDMIFSIICEELGLFGAVCIIILYLLLLWRCLFIAMHAKDLFGSYLTIGIMTHLAIHVILNIAVVTNTLPNTGVTLPFISYGGTSIAILIVEVGMVLGVSRGIEPDD